MTELRRRVSIGLAAALLLAFAGLDIAQSRTLRDHKPHHGVKAAHAMPVQGIDVSYWQGDIDWHKVRGAGIRFAPARGVRLSARGTVRAAGEQRRTQA